MTIDLELATTEQLMNELVKRDLPFVFLIPPNHLAEYRDSVQCHIYGLGPQQTLGLLKETTDLIEKVVEGGELPNTVRFFVKEMDENGNQIRQIRLGPNLQVMREDEDDPWSGDDN
jgi:hypothetical protein